MPAHFQPESQTRTTLPSSPFRRQHGNSENQGGLGFDNACRLPESGAGQCIGAGTVPTSLSAEARFPADRGSQFSCHAISTAVFVPFRAPWYGRLPGTFFSLAYVSACECKKDGPNAGTALLLSKSEPSKVSPQLQDALQQLQLEGRSSSPKPLPALVGSPPLLENPSSSSGLATHPGESAEGLSEDGGKISDIGFRDELAKLPHRWRRAWLGAGHPGGYPFSSPQVEGRFLWLCWLHKYLSENPHLVTKPGKEEGSPTAPVLPGASVLAQFLDSSSTGWEFFLVG